MITLVRHTVDPEATPLAPFPELVETRYQQWLAQQQSGMTVPVMSQSDPPQAQTSPRFTESQIHWLQVIKSYIALNGAFATDDQTDYLEAWQSVDSDDLSAIASATAEGVPLAVAKRVFGHDPKAIIEELNEVLVA